MHAEQASHVVSDATVGGITPAMRPGRLVIPDHLIDYAHGRATTFAPYGNGDQVTHIDFTWWPYCETLRQRCISVLRELGEAFSEAGTYAAVQGPRPETKAEIDRLDRDEVDMVDMVDMTGMPEAYLAREIGLCYATVAVSSNWAAGRGDSSEAISAEGIEQHVQAMRGRVRAILVKLAHIGY